MQPVQIPFLGHIIALAVGSFLISFFVTAFIVPIQIITWIATGAAVVGVLHHHNLTSFITHIKGGDTIMDLLDRFTNKQTLERMVAGDPSAVINRPLKAEIFDEEAVRSALKANIIGQDAVVDEMTTTLRRRLAMMQREKPVAVLLFAGPPGVGKTELAKQMGKIMGRPFCFLT
jgi:Holliday junction DNA helicase RuvB P-loop domain